MSLPLLGAGPGAGGEAAPATFRSILMDLTPALYWPLDAVDGATDQSGNARNGTGSGGVTIGGHTATSPAIVDEDASCTDFDGSNDKITSTYAPWTNGRATSFIGWARRDANTTSDVLFGSTGDGDVLFLNGGSDTARFTTFGGGAESDDWAGFTAAAWHFWALVFDEPNNTAAFYRNGALVTSLAHPGTWFGSNGNFEVGATGATSNPFDGKQAHVAVFESGLTAQNISDLYDAATGA